MRVGYVQNMNVIAEARSVVSRIIVTENLEGLPLATCDLQQQRNDVGFRPMIFPDCGRPPARVEVPKGNNCPIVCTCVPTQRTLQHEFSLAIRIDRILEMVLGNRSGLRIPIDSRRRGEHKLPNACSTRLLEQRNARSYIRIEEDARIGNLLWY
jgi:hypothetical protein